MSRLLYSTLSLALMGFTVTAQARADELTFGAALPPRTAPWVDTLSIQGFDPALGDLTEVRFELGSTITGQVGVENRAPGTDQATLVFAATVVAQVPSGGPSVVLNPSDPIQLLLAPFDGTLDYGGSSGALFSSLFGQASSVGSGTPAAFVGAGTVDVPISVVKSLSAVDATDLSFRGIVSAGVTLTVTYVFTPLPDCDEDGTPDVNEPDCDADGIPDDCEPDCDGDSVPDDCEIDSDGDGCPDDCDVEIAAEPGYTRPGSLLLFPEFDNRAGRVSIMTVTNTDGDALAKNIFIKFVFVEGEFCTYYDRTEVLTPNDTLTFLTSQFIPIQGNGYMYAYALSSFIGPPIVHNHLIGSAIHTSGLSTFDYGTSALSFLGIGAPGAPTDANADGRLGFDGVEYDAAPATVLVPRFLGAGGTLSSDLILLNLTGALHFQANVGLLVYNDNEEVFSALRTIDCWDRIPIAAISPLFTNAFLQTTNHDPSEIVGATNIESGWLNFRGVIAFDTNTGIPNPSVLGVLVERQAGTSSAALPFNEGTRINGSLVGP